jgi:hypothetical protein
MSDEVDFVSIHGPLEIQDGKFVLRIPLEVGGDKLAKIVGTIGRVEGHILQIEIPERLASNVMGWKEGDIVSVDNQGGLLNIEAWDGGE